ncbi:uncharacterized protein LOC100844290 isoform X2 [Brachypodium distachyon]|nr:uncharacterized protein LOC100844290 isoform X2 [Brachypodium distachyon]KQK01353.1 hypothetical protein BRADI_3g55360v3 [Brachypodium distachyon]|eukprot:XP_014757029.1 uncharacterized protein LOC100844290 isoform X2 [Brachypodium distachyon]
MSTKITITYKRKHGLSHALTVDSVIPDPPPASSSVVTSSEAPKHRADADDSMLNEDDSATSIKNQDACKSVQQSVKENTPKAFVHGSEKEQARFLLSESLPWIQQPEISCATSLQIREACQNKLQCTNDADDPILASSSLCDLRQDGGTSSQAEDSTNPAGVNFHQGLKDTARPSQCKSRFSPLLTFHRRVKRKINLDEPAEEIYSKDIGKQCLTLTCSPASSSFNAAALHKETCGNSLDTGETVTAAETSTGLTVPAEQKSSHVLKSTLQHTVLPQCAENVNQCLIPERDGTQVSEFTSVRDISETDVRMEDSSKIPSHVIKAPEVVEVKENRHDDPLESEDSTKHIPIILLDGDTDERGKEQENPEVLDQMVNKSRFTLGKINLNCAELPQERLLNLDDLSVQRLPDQDHFGTERKQVSLPIERLFFTKEKDSIHGKQQHQEGTSTMPTLYSNFFDPTPSLNVGSLKEPSSMPSELKFRIMDKVPEFSLDLSLDSFGDSNVSALRHDKLFRGGNSSGSDLLTERLGTYSYKRRPAPWSEEELDFLWIGVRRYGINNWKAMLRDTRLRFSNSRIAEDLAKQWDKEQKKLLGVDIFQSVRASALGPAPSPHISDDYVGSSSCSGCSKSPFLAAQTKLSLSDLYLRNSHASERGHHHLSSLGRLNLHGVDKGPRNLSLGGFPTASSSYGRSSSRRRKSSKFHKSYYDSRTHRCQEAPERVSRLFPMNQQLINGLPQWLTKDVETGTSRLNPGMWPSMPAPGHSAADPHNDSLRAACMFPDDTKPYFKSWAAAIAGPNSITASDNGASSEETVSDS